MNILQFGCSFSCFEGRHLQNTNTLPLNALLSNRLPDNVNLYNCALGGSGTSLQLNLLENVLENFGTNIDFILFQISSPFRGYWQFEDIELKSIHAKKHNNYYDFSGYIKQGYKWYNYGSTYPTSRPHEGFSTFVEYNKKFSQNYELDHCANILLAKKILVKSNIPFVFYSHNLKSFDIINKIVSDEIDFDIESLLGARFREFVIDEGHHFSVKGNTFIIDNFLLPSIKEKLDI